MKELDLEWFKALTVLPDSFGNLASLKELDLEWFKALTVLPDSFGN